MYNEEDYEGLGYYNSDATESYEFSNDDDIQFVNIEPTSPKPPSLVYAQDTLSHVINQNIPIVLLASDLNTTVKLCSSNKRLYKICQMSSFWYLKLEYQYPGYVAYYKKSTTYLHKIIYKAMTSNAQDYYILYTRFRACLDTTNYNMDDKIYINDKKNLNTNYMIDTYVYDINKAYGIALEKSKNSTYTVVDAIGIMYNHHPSMSIMLKLLSLILPYVRKNIVNYNNIGDLTAKLVNALTDGKESYVGRLKYLDNLKNGENVEERLRWKIIKCIVQLYYNYT